MSLTPEQVANYLTTHPEFFVEHPALLMALKIPHATGSARSLIEYQVSCLRQRNQELNLELNHIHAIAHQNEQLFRLCTQLTAELLGCSDLLQAIHRLETYSQQHFQMHYISLKIFQSTQDRQLSNYVVGRDRAIDVLGQQFAQQGTLCGPLRPAALQFLFGDAGKHLGSVALIALGEQAGHGVLALGSQDARKFDAQMGTLFLSYIGDIMTRLLPSWLEHDAKLA